MANSVEKITTVEAANEAINAVVETLKSQQRAYKSFEKIQARANAKLYSVLGEAFAAYASLMSGEKSEKNAKINAFKEKIANQKSQFAKASTAATSLQLRIVRYVCGNIADKTATNYARVIKVAYDNEVQNMDMTFSEWVILSGGIDNVRATKNGETPKNFLKVGKAICETSEAVNPVAAAEDSGHDFSVALLRHNDDGTYDIVWSTNKDAITNAVLKAAGKDLDAATTADKEDADEAARIAAQNADAEPANEQAAPVAKAA